MSATIRFAGVTKRYPGGHEALVDASFSLDGGTFAYLTGPSGAGKSTVLKLVAGIERPTQGTVLVNQQNVGRLSARALPWLRRNLGLVMPEVALLDDRSVGDNVRLPLDIAGVERGDAARRVRAALDKVGLAGRERARPPGLSGGEQQRVAIARAIVHRPSALLADEPTAGLDADAADVVLALFRDFHAVGVTVMIATHDAGVMARHAGRRIALERGRVVGDGTG
ncbi:MAG TPA: ATP-binding cassette domain-containing protein [Casimicrobiaceae bacterium]|nr:ATP-binding cassette domain-containing protein [Casimicrobiaceae bacterium]